MIDPHVIFSEFVRFTSLELWQSVLINASQALIQSADYHTDKREMWYDNMSSKEARVNHVSNICFRFALYYFEYENCFWWHILYILLCFLTTSMPVNLALKDTPKRYFLGTGQSYDYSDASEVTLRYMAEPTGTKPHWYTTKYEHHS